MILMAASRMYLGVHTLLDVAVGAAAGIAWVFAANAIFLLCRAKEPEGALAGYVYSYGAGNGFHP